MPVRTRPLSGIAVGSTTSNAEMRSDATSSSRSSSIANMSRTLPERTKPGSGSATDMRVVLQLVQPMDELVHVGEQSGFVEAVGDLVGCQHARDVCVGGNQLAQLASLIGGA